MCLTAKSTDEGAGIEMQRCGTVSTALERWKVLSRLVWSGDFLESTTAFQLANTNLCMTYHTVGNGAPITLETCDTGKKQSFDPRGGVIRPGWGDFCFNVLGGTDAVGQQLGLWPDCSGTGINSFFYLSGAIKSMGQCVDLLWGTSYSGAPIGMYPCTGGGNQSWDYYWL